MSPPRSHGREVPGPRCKPWPSCWRAEEKPQHLVTQEMSQVSTPSLCCRRERSNTWCGQMGDGMSCRL